MMASMQFHPILTFTLLRYWYLEMKKKKKGILKGWRMLHILPTCNVDTQRRVDCKKTFSLIRFLQYDLSTTVLDLLLLKSQLLPNKDISDLPESND